MVVREKFDNRIESSANCVIAFEKFKPVCVLKISRLNFENLKISFTEFPVASI